MLTITAPVTRLGLAWKLARLVLDKNDAARLFRSARNLSATISGSHPVTVVGKSEATVASFNPIDIIGKTRDGIALNRDELHFFIKGALTGQVSPAQVGAWYVASEIKTLSSAEVGYLKEIEADYGQVVAMVNKALGLALHMVEPRNKIQQIITKTIIKTHLTKEEIFTLVKGIVAQEGEAGYVNDLQAGAWLMAVRLNGLNENETAYLSEAMWKTGGEIDLSSIKAPSCDKHAAGGSSDNTSFIIAPLLACFGVVVPMMSGRMLAHTGGTLDKLESIPGFRVNLSEAEVIEGLKGSGLAIFGQMPTIAPADGRLYRLRQLTGTVQSVPLIAASIISKKLAEGAENLALVATFGSGAFAKDPEEAKELSLLMKAAAEKAGRKVTSFVVDMSQPLASFVGPSQEMQLAIRVLQGYVGSRASRLHALSIEIAARLLVMAGKYDEAHIIEAKTALAEKLKNGEALDKFRQMIIAQGGDPAVIEDERLFHQAPIEFKVLAPRDGYVQAIRTDEIGNAVNDLGAGRTEARPKICHGVGAADLKLVGDPVIEGTVLAVIYANDLQSAQVAAGRIQKAYTIGDERVAPPTLIHEVIK